MDTKNSNTNNFIIITMIILAAFRIYLGKAVGNWMYIWETDDMLMIRYSLLMQHFTSPNIFSMVKTIAFSLFILFIRLLNIDYSTAVSLLWVIASLSSYILLKRITGSKIIPLISYIYFLFLPIAFEQSIIRLYRNGILAPLTITIFCILFVFLSSIIKNTHKYIKLIITSVVLSMVFIFFYYIKEDGIWLAVSIFAFCSLTGIAIVIKAIQKKISAKQMTIYILCLVLPFVLLKTADELYREINYKYFGVREIQTRTSGELGKFVSYIYTVDSPEQNYRYWTTKDQIMAVYNASHTLQQHPEILQVIFNKNVYPGSRDENYNIKGDFFTWILREALNASGLWKSESYVNNLFKQVNSEIQIAFDSGKLKTSDKIYLSHAAVGRTLREILDLIPLVLANIKDAITLSGYNPGPHIMKLSDYAAQKARLAVAMTGLYYISDYTLRSKTEMKAVNHIVKWDIKAYKYINVILAFITIFSFFYIIKILVNNCIKEKDFKDIKEYTTSIQLLVCIMLLCGIAFCYSFAINWFASFDYLNNLKIYIIRARYYTPPLPGIIGVIYFLSVANLYLTRKLTHRENIKHTDQAC